MFYEKIVAVDDNARSLESLQLIFQKHYEVVCFNSGEPAIEYLKKPNSVRLALVDVFMKGVDGISVLRQIKEINQDIAVVIMTAFGSKEVVLRALQNDADDFIEKPFDVGEIKDKVRSVLAKKPTFSAGREETPRRMRYFVERNVEDVSLRDVAGEVCLSEKYVSRLFKKKNDCCFREYKIRVKVEKAKDLLGNSSYPVYRISEMLGYQNPETFMRMFKRRTELTPLQYRDLVTSGSGQTVAGETRQA